MADKDDGSSEGYTEFSFDADRPPIRAVIDAVATVTDCRPVKGGDSEGDAEVLEPIYRTVDPEALNALVASSQRGSPAGATVIFRYCGHEVIVESDGVVRVSDEPVDARL